MKLINKVDPIGFTINLFPTNNRLQVIRLSADTINAFKLECTKMSVQSLEYKAFLRFVLADALDKITNYTLGSFLYKTLNSRDTGCFLLEYDGQPNNSDEAIIAGDFHVQLSTAVSHLCGIPNHDSMYGKYYARFTVESDDDSDSYLRQGQRRMELHNDGTYVSEKNDFVLMMKMFEEHMVGGDSLLLHLDDWQDLNKFYNHPLAKKPIQWGSPASKKVDTKIHHAVFIDEDKNGKPQMSFIDQFCEPQNSAEALYLYELGESLESDDNCFNVRVPVGSMLVVQNHMWLHGRDKFVLEDGLKRELLRQRGHFTK